MNFLYELRSHKLSIALQLDNRHTVPAAIKVNSLSNFPYTLELSPTKAGLREESVQYHAYTCGVAYATPANPAIDLLRWASQIGGRTILKPQKVTPQIKNNPHELTQAMIFENRVLLDQQIFFD